jgi:signal peptidase complex subunit 3
MHTVLTRLNALAAYTMSVLAVLTSLCFLNTFVLVDYQSVAELNTVNVVVKHVSDYSASREKVKRQWKQFQIVRL